MNYTREQCDEARRRIVDGQPWEKIVEVFATVPQVTLEEAVQIRSEYYRRVGPEGIKTAQEIMQQVVNAVLAKRGTGIAAKPADGMVSLEDALADFTLPEFTCLPSGPVATPFDWVNMAFQFRRSLLIKPEPTVTLVDAAEGRTLEVPARAVHKMEYPEDVTYTHDPWANKDVCNLCGAYVYDQTKHTAWHGREGVL